MDQDRACAVTPEQLKIEKRRQKIAHIKYAIRFFFWRMSWRLLHFTMLAIPYSKLACKLNYYRRFADGRCMWCGFNHYEGRP